MKKLKISFLLPTLFFLSFSLEASAAYTHDDFMRVDKNGKSSSIFVDDGEAENSLSMPKTFNPTRIERFLDASFPQNKHAIQKYSYEDALRFIASISLEKIDNYGGGGARLLWHRLLKMTIDQGKNISSLDHGPFKRVSTSKAATPEQAKLMLAIAYQAGKSALFFRESFKKEVSNLFSWGCEWNNSKVTQHNAIQMMAYCLGAQTSQTDEQHKQDLSTLIEELKEKYDATYSAVTKIFKTNFIESVLQSLTVKDYADFFKKSFSLKVTQNNFYKHYLDNCSQIDDIRSVRKLRGPASIDWELEEIKNHLKKSGYAEASKEFNLYEKVKSYYEISIALQRKEDNKAIQALSELKKKSDITKLYFDKMSKKTLLMEATKRGMQKLAEWLLEEGFSADTTDLNGSSSLHHALKACQSNLVKFYLSRDKELSATLEPFYVKEALLAIFGNSQKNAIEIFELLSQYGIDLISIQQGNETLLDHAETCKYERANMIIEYLRTHVFRRLREGVHLNLSNAENELIHRTPVPIKHSQEYDFAWKLIKEYPENIRKAIELGINLNVYDSEGNHIFSNFAKKYFKEHFNLMLFLKKQDVNTFEILLENGIVPQKRDFSSFVDPYKLRIYNFDLENNEYIEKLLISLLKYGFRGDFMESTDCLKNLFNNFSKIKK